MRTKGLWVSPTQFVSFAEIKRNRLVEQHIATRSRMDGGMGGLSLPNPDPILKASGKDVATYRELLSQPRIGGNVRRRKAAVLGMERGLRRDDAPENVFRFVEDWLKDMDMDRIVRELLDAPLYGYQPVELMWRPSGRIIVPADVLGKPAEWFRYDRDNALRFMALDAGSDGELCDPVRFVVARQDATYANPYGFPDLSMCFWPGTFLKGGLKFWVQFTEKYGSPWVIGKHPRGADDRETDLLLDSLEAMVQDAVAAIPDDSSIEIKEATGKSASSDVYRSLLEYCRSDINVALLGQDQTTEKDSNRASATAGAEVTKDIRDSDMGVVLAALNRIIRLVVDVNFGESVDAPVYAMWEQEVIDKAQAERDQILSGAGLKFTPAYWKRTYGLEEGDIDTRQPSGEQTGVAFAEGDAAADTTDYADVATPTLAKQAQPIIDRWLGRIAELVDSAPDLPTLQQRLLAEFGSLDEADLVDVMGTAFAAAELAGRAELNDEVDNG